jgi:hypothetical protein
MVPFKAGIFMGFIKLPVLQYRANKVAAIVGRSGGMVLLKTRLSMRITLIPT